MSDTNPDDLLTMAEVADLIGVTLLSVQRYRQRGIMPQPDAQYGRTRTWKRSTIEAWDATREKRPTVRKASA